MDNLTHSLVGAVLGQAGLKKKTGLAMPALIIGANLPDVDAACFFWLEGVEHLGFRRGITHGPPAMVLLPLILAVLLWGFDRWQAKRGKRPEGRLPVHFGWLFALAFIGCLTHPALDWLNVYGVRFLEPFSSQWYYGDTLFIIDVWLWALLIGSLWWSLRTEKRGGNWMRPAWVGIAAGLAYIGWNFLTSHGATAAYAINGKSAGAAHWAMENDVPRTSMNAISAPVPFWPTERELIVGEPNNWFVVLPGEDLSPRNAKPVTANRCAWPDLQALRKGNSQIDAFLFWSRAPFAERAEDGSVFLRDARFYDPRARDRFSVALPDVKCEELPAE